MLILQVEEFTRANDYEVLATLQEGEDGWYVRPQVPGIRAGFRKTLDGALSDIRARKRLPTTQVTSTATMANPAASGASDVITVTPNGVASVANVTGPADVDAAFAEGNDNVPAQPVLKPYAERDRHATE